MSSRFQACPVPVFFPAEPLIYYFLSKELSFCLGFEVASADFFWKEPWWDKRMPIFSSVPYPVRLPALLSLKVGFWLSNRVSSSAMKCPPNAGNTLLF